MINQPIIGDRFPVRIGINGFLNRDALWGTEDDKPSDRFELLGLKYNGWKTNRKEKIIVALQLAGDASLRNQNINEWCLDSVKKISKYTITNYIIINPLTTL